MSDQQLLCSSIQDGPLSDTVCVADLQLNSDSVLLLVINEPEVRARVAFVSVATGKLDHRRFSAPGSESLTNFELELSTRLDVSVRP